MRLWNHDLPSPDECAYGRHLLIQPVLDQTRFQPEGRLGSLPANRAVRRVSGMSAGPPIAIEICAAQRTALCAKSELMHRSKQPLHSITSSADANSVGGIVRPSGLGGLEIDGDVPGARLKKIEIAAISYLRDFFQREDND